MTSATAGVIKFLSGELDAARDAAQKARVVNEQCKPMIRNLAGQYDAEDEEARLDKKLKDYDAGFMALRAMFARGSLQGQVRHLGSSWPGAARRPAEGWERSWGDLRRPSDAFLRG